MQCVERIMARVQADEKSLRGKQTILKAPGDRTSIGGIKRLRWEMTVLVNLSKVIDAIHFVVGRHRAASVVMYLN